MADGKSPRKQSTFTDVTKPGKTAPSASSRPIIVGHKPSIQDPMVNDENSSVEEPKMDVKRTAPKVVEPLNSSAEQKQVVAESSKNVEASDVTDTESGIVQSGLDTDRDSEVAEMVESTDKDNSTATVDAVIGQDAKDKSKKVDKKADELAKREEEVQKLIDSKKYFVNVTPSTSNKRKKAWVLLLVVVLLLIGAYIAVDAQIIKNNIKLPYEFFREVKTEKAPSPVTEPSAVKKDVNEESSEKDNQTSSFGGEVVESIGKKFSIKVPNGWRLVNLTDSDGLYPADINSADSLEYKSSERPVITQQPTIGTDGPVRFSVNYLEAGQVNGFLNEQMTKTVFALDDGIKGARYYYQEPLKDAEGLGAYPGEKQYIYEFETKDGGKVVVVYRILEKNQYIPANELPKSDLDRLDLVEKVIKTLKIN